MGSGGGGSRSLPVGRGLIVPSLTEAMALTLALRGGAYPQPTGRCNTVLAENSERAEPNHPPPPLQASEMFEDGGGGFRIAVEDLEV